MRAPRPYAHLWIYNHPFHGISDQVEYFLSSMRQNGYEATVGRRPRIDAQNVVIENFSEITSQTLIDFCAQTGKRVAVIMTEHLDFIDRQIYIHGDPLWNDNDYMHPATQVARIKNLLDCIQYIRCFFVLGDLPELLNFNEILPGAAIRTLPFPHLHRMPPSNLVQGNSPYADVVFTGYSTSYRDALLGELEACMSVVNPGTFVSRHARDNLSRSARIVLNIPQRQDWKWLSLMRIIAALRCGRATVSLGSADNSKISECCSQLDISRPEWVAQLLQQVSSWESAYEGAFDRYELMASEFEKEHPFPHDLFEYWAVTENCA